LGQLHCLNCNTELPDDNFHRHQALVLSDERRLVPEILGAWCDEKCLGEWLVKNALDAMMKRMLFPSAN